jgi:hypothetical protein
MVMLATLLGNGSLMPLQTRTASSFHARKSVGVRTQVSSPLPKSMAAHNVRSEISRRVHSRGAGVPGRGSKSKSRVLQSCLGCESFS